jgi:ribonucleoside-diphosphate reductase alpha chain
MTAARKRLPNRRANTSIGFQCEGFHYRATAGYFDGGGLAEIFLEVPGKAGTPLESNANTAAILTSLLLQHGVAPDAIRHSVSGPIAVALSKLSGRAE